MTLLGFVPKMHQIRFRLEEVTSLPRPLAGFKLAYCQEEGGEGKGQEGLGRGRENGDGPPIEPNAAMECAKPQAATK